MNRVVGYIVRFAIAMAGYVTAVITAVLVGVFLALLVTVLPHEGEWGSFSRSASDLMAVIEYGLILTFPFAFPGFIVALILAQIFRWRRWLPFSITGAVNGLFSILVLGFYANESPANAPAVLVIPCIPAGFAGGFAYWASVGRLLARWREAEGA